MTFDPFTIIMLAVLAVLIFFMFRNSRKRQAEARNLQSKVQTGAKVMTNFGVFGTILSIDEDEHQVLLETSPGTVLTVAAVAATEVAPAEGEPEYGERVDDAPTDETPDTKKSDD
jgi:preprotein translocase subunit YajC